MEKTTLTECTLPMGSRPEGLIFNAGPITLIQATAGSKDPPTAGCSHLFFSRLVFCLVFLPRGIYFLSLFCGESNSLPLQFSQPLSMLVSAGQQGVIESSYSALVVIMLLSVPLHLKSLYIENARHRSPALPRAFKCKLWRWEVQEADWDCGDRVGGDGKSERGEAKIVLNGLS